MTRKKPARVNQWKLDNEAFLAEKAKEEGLAVLDNGVIVQVLEKGHGTVHPKPALVLRYALSGSNISGKDRAIILGALGYLILPVDLLPDFIPGVGLTDDVAALTFAVWKVMRNITPEVRVQADAKVRELFGDYDKDDIDISFPD